MTEKELIDRCGKGENLARKQLYERYAGQLLAVCIRYVGDRDVAQDVLHDSFLNIYIEPSTVLPIKAKVP